MPLETPARDALLAACPLFRDLEVTGAAAVAASRLKSSSRPGA